MKFGALKEAGLIKGPGTGGEKNPEKIRPGCFPGRGGIGPQDPHDSFPSPKKTPIFMANQPTPPPSRTPPPKKKKK